jgi:hypothetical protein
MAHLAIPDSTGDPQVPQAPKGGRGRALQRRIRDRAHPTGESFDALERVLLGFPGDLLEKYVLGRGAPPDRHNRRRPCDPKSG